MKNERKHGRRADVVEVWKPRDGSNDKSYGFYPNERLHVSQREDTEHGPLATKVKRPSCPHCGSENVRHSDRSETECEECGHVKEESHFKRDKIAAQRINERSKSD